MSVGSSASTIRLGTGGSALALARSQRVADSISARTGSPVEIITISTESGAEASVAAVRGALLERQCDVVVHSLSDVPTAPHPDLSVMAIPRRGDARDALVAHGGLTLEHLPAGARVGVGSGRRRAQLRRRRDDVEVVDVQGAADTLVGRVVSTENESESSLDAVVLAVADLEWVGRDDAITERFGIAGWPTSPGQGALALESLTTVSGPLRSALQGIDHPSTRTSVDAERMVLRLLEPQCAAHLGAHAFIDGGMLFLAARAYSDRGEQVSAAHALYVDDTRTPGTDAAKRVVDELLALGAADLSTLGDAAHGVRG